jgi:nucleotide-binding universal stress UspA family protein
MKALTAHHRTGTLARSRPVPPRRGSRALRTRTGSVVFKRILVPVDFTAGSDRALRYAAALALAHRARVLPFHATPPICLTVDCGYGSANRQMPNETSLRQTRARLQRLVHRVVPIELAEDVTVRSGEPIEQIVIAAKEWRADLIVMLAHEALGKNSAPPTHTVDRLVREVRCPVLVLHTGAPYRDSKTEDRRRSA